MTYELDTHIHSVSSGHAYSTITENAEYAAKIGLKLIAVTDHAPEMPGSCGKFHFSNFKALPKFINGVELLNGVELNIMDKYGKVDLEENVIKKLDVVIASLHIPCIKPMSMEENTEAVINVMENPLINILGHPGDPRYPIDIVKVVDAAKKTDTLIEINNMSLNPKNPRFGGNDIILEIIRECKRKQQPIILGSDAHYHIQIGDFSFADALIKEAEMPKELILNYSVKDYKQYIGIV